jgi:predicted nucleic acid-binding Zn ribbon protein
MICQCCGKEFKSKANSQKYCSQECYGKARAARDKAAREKRKEQAVCVVCGKTFKRKGYEKICSEECRKVSRKVHERVCRTCGKVFMPTQDHKKFCSAECKKNAKKVEKPKPIKKLNISAIARNARELGMSYGKYVEYLEKNKIILQVP